LHFHVDEHLATHSSRLSFSCLSLQAEQAGSIIAEYKLSVRSEHPQKKMCVCVAKSAIDVLSEGSHQPVVVANQTESVRSCTRLPGG
jgi:hypothetical protein